MLLIKQHIERDLSGQVTLRPQEDEDMWHAYNLIQEVRVPPDSAVQRSADSRRATSSEGPPFGELGRALAALTGQTSHDRDRDGELLLASRASPSDHHCDQSDLLRPRRV